MKGANCNDEIDLEEESEGNVLDGTSGHAFSFIIDLWGQKNGNLIVLVGGLVLRRLLGMPVFESDFTA